MSRFVRKHKHEIGLPPDELLFIGKQKTDEVVLRLIDYDGENLQELNLNSIKEILPYKTKNSVSWLNVDGLHNQKIMNDISEYFDLDKVILADVMNTEGRPKLAEHSNCLFLSIKMIYTDIKSGKPSIENLSLILSDNILISFQERKGDVFEPIRDRVRKQKKRIINSGIDYLTFALLDIVVDNYIYTLGILGEKIEELEESLLTNPVKNVIDNINKYKRELNFLRRHITPARDMILSLLKLESELITDSTQIHLNELFANISLAQDSSESYREILSDQLNIYHTTISSKLNDIMKFLTIFSVIFIPLTFIAGIYGTNFDFLPELHYRYSYFIMLGVMLLLAIGMLIYFKFKKWL